MDTENEVFRSDEETSPSYSNASITPSGHTLSENVLIFLKRRHAYAQRFFAGEASTIKVSEVLGSLAYLYERIRNVVEYKNEHIMRRSGIDRILKRLLWERSTRDINNIAHALLRELIWARYLPNDHIPKRKIADVAAIINKYLFFIGTIIERGTSIPHNELRQWVWGVASCEIEETLDPISREPYIELMYQWFMTQFHWENGTLSEADKQTQIYLAVHRALTKSDEHIMRYHLLLKKLPHWRSADKSAVTETAQNFWPLYEEIEKQLQYSDRFTLYRAVQKHTAPFEILREMAAREGTKTEQILAQPEVFEQKVREICAIRYGQIAEKVRRGILRSIIYIFITKVIFALIIEIPYELLVFGDLIYIPLLINIILPPTLMFLIGLTIKPPGESNTVRIFSLLKTIVYEPPVVTRTTFSLAKARRGSFLANIFAVIYLFLFIAVFGGITYLLWLLNFTPVGIVIFFAFLSLVLLFGFRVRYTATELSMTAGSESFFGYVFNNLTLPFLSTGVYLSKGLAKINFLTLILDFLIEAPLKTIIEVIEEWTSFIREKREEVVEVPHQ